MKHKISEAGARMLKYQEQLAREYKYKPIPRTFFKDVRAEFKEALPEWCNVSGDTTKLETSNGTVIASGYNRIVIGDYGAFVEFSRAQANSQYLIMKAMPRKSLRKRFSKRKLKTFPTMKLQSVTSKKPSKNERGKMFV